LLQVTPFSQLPSLPAPAKMTVFGVECPRWWPNFVLLRIPRISARPDRADLGVRVVAASLLPFISFIIPWQFCADSSPAWLVATPISAGHIGGYVMPFAVYVMWVGSNPSTKARVEICKALTERHHLTGNEHSAAYLTVTLCRRTFVRLEGNHTASRVTPALH
jgi:hypothetical protein